MIWIVRIGPRTDQNENADLQDSRAAMIMVLLPRWIEYITQPGWTCLQLDQDLSDFHSARSTPPMEQAKLELFAFNSNIY